MLPGITPFLAGYPPIVVSVSTTSVSNTQSSASISTAVVTGSVSGGSGSFSFLWLHSGDDIFAQNPSSPATAFQADDLASPETRVAEFILRATDNASGDTGFSPPVTVTIRRL